MSLLSVTPCNIVTNISHLDQTPPLTGSLDQREGEYWKHFKNINQSKKCPKSMCSTLLNSEKQPDAGVV